MRNRKKEEIFNAGEPIATKTITVRYSTDDIDRLDRLIESGEAAGVRITRTQVMRMALSTFLDGTEGKEPDEADDLLEKHHEDEIMV